MDTIYGVIIAAIVAVVGIVAIVYGYEIKKLKNLMDYKGDKDNEN